MSTVIVTETATDWDLIVAVVRRGQDTNLESKLIRDLNRELWQLQDGYGSPGFTPPQGWDWSGIRD